MWTEVMTWNLWLAISLIHLRVLSLRVWRIRIVARIDSTADLSQTCVRWSSCRLIFAHKTERSPRIDWGNKVVPFVERASWATQRISSTCQDLCWIRILSTFLFLYLHVLKLEVFTPVITVCLLWQLCKAHKAREEDNGFKTSTVRNNRLKIKIALMIAKSGAYIRSELKEFRTVLRFRNQTNLHEMTSPPVNLTYKKN